MESYKKEINLTNFSGLLYLYNVSYNVHNFPYKFENLIIMVFYNNASLIKINYL